MPRTVPPLTALTNVRVFDGSSLLAPATVVIDGALIGTDPTGADTVDCAGATLLPGLIDAHIHLHGTQVLEQLADHGVTTGLDMASWPPSLPESLRETADAGGLTAIRSAGLPAIGPGGPHATMLGLPDEAIVDEPGDAEGFVAARVAEGSDYIKIVTEAPGHGGPDQPTLNALVAAAHARGKLVVAHAAAAGAYAMAQEARADVLTHAPLDQPLDGPAVALMAGAGRTVVPTLTMMERVASLRAAPAPDAPSAAPAPDYAHARTSVTALHRAGVPVLAGTDANFSAGSPANVPHGESLHRELELLVAAGLSTVDALNAATRLPARHFSLADRGAVRPGLRADLVLIDGDPVRDIRATRRIQRVWCGGVQRLGR